VRGEDRVVELLNEVLTAELTAVNQYFLDAMMFDHWGYKRLGKRFRNESIGEMNDSEALIKRILYLEGHPNLQRLGSVRTGEAPTEKLTLALDLERQAILRLNQGIAVCAEQGDNGSKDLLQDILDGEEEYAEWLESQLEAMGQIGDANYLAQQLHD
jgi:bacterioferritin